MNTHNQGLVVAGSALLDVALRMHGQQADSIVTQIQIVLAYHWLGVVVPVAAVELWICRNCHLYDSVTCSTGVLLLLLVIFLWSGTYKEACEKDYDKNESNEKTTKARDTLLTNPSKEAGSTMHPCIYPSIIAPMLLCCAFCFLRCWSDSFGGEF